MDEIRILVGTSLVLGAILGALSFFVFSLPLLAAAGIMIATILGLFMITLVLNSITYKRSMRSFRQE